MSIKLGLTFLVLVTISVGAGATVDISSVTVSAIKTDSVVIDWDSTVAGTSQIEYGTTVSYGSITQEESLSYFHTTELSGLAEGTLYHFRIKSKEYGGVETISADYTFTTRTQAQLEAVIRAARADGGLPKTYYVSPDGNDANNGFSTSAPFQHPSYAVNKTDAGDTVYLMDGTWTNEYITFPKSGIDVAPITLTAINKGMALLDGLDNTVSVINGKVRVGITVSDISSNFTHNYINVINLKITNYYIGINVREAHHINISDTEIYNVTGSALFLIDDNNILAQNNNLHDAGGWNYGNDLGDSIVQIQTNYYPTYKYNIINNIIKDNPGRSRMGASIGHNLIDLNNNNVNNTIYLQDINISNNNLSFNTNFAMCGIWTHGVPYTFEQISVVGNTYNGGRSFQVSMLQNSIIKDNNIHNTIYGIEITIPTNNTIIENNTVQDSLSGYDTYIDAPATFAGLFLINNSIKKYRINNGIGSIADEKNTPITIRSVYGGTIIFKYTKGFVFNETGANTAYYYPDRSEYTTIGDEEIIIARYPMTARPVAGSATITVNKFDTTLTKGNILADFTADTTSGNNVDFVIGDLKAGANYQITRAGADYHIIQSNANNCIQFFNSEWSAKTFTVTETDAAADIITPPEIEISSGTILLPLPTVPTAPQNLSATAGDSQVSLSWQTPTSDGGSAITGYKIYRGFSSGNETLLDTVGTQLSYPNPVVNNGQTYYYQVAALNSVGEGPRSNEAKATSTTSSVGSGGLEAVKVYPNPYINGKSAGEKITFANLPTEATIKIYTSSGKLVKELTGGSDGKAEWNISDITGGIYLYIISSDEGTRKGKVSVIK